MKLQQARMAAEIYKALSHPTRLMMVEALARGECSTSDFKKIARVSQSNVSRHATLLKRAGLITDRRVGLSVIYQLQSPQILDTLPRIADVAHAHARRRLAQAKGESSAVA